MIVTPQKGLIFLCAKLHEAGPDPMTRTGGRHGSPDLLPQMRIASDFEEGKTNP
jgi:hypothetical protein